MNDYVIVNGRKFRKGYTTGSCAAAASKAAVAMLLSSNALECISIDTPAGVRLELPVSDVEFLSGAVKCSVIKDGGDDPDVTSGLKIFAEARFTNSYDIEIKAGEGIGIVTFPGLKVEIGKPAINPIPMQMILKEVKELLLDNRGLEIIISIPSGEEIAEKTYNPKLGIRGGLSILGTTGIVTPMSEEAWKEAIALELNVAVSNGLKDIVFTFGNYGEKFAISKMHIDESRVIKISNFIGYMLDRAMDSKVDSILLVGHLGKLVKVAAGIFHTHSRTADARMEIMAAYAALEGASKEVVEQVYECRTTEAAAEIIKENGYIGVFDRIVNNVSKRCSEYMFNRIKVGTILFNEDNTLLSLDNVAKEILTKLGSRYEK